MLLSLMRKHAKSWLIKFLIAIIAIVFIFYFGYSFKSDEGIKVASVNGELISGKEYQKAKRNRLEALQRTYKNVWSDNLIDVFDVKNRALQELVDQILISQEAKRIGLDVTKEEIQQRISAYPAFQFRGRFDLSRYQSLLQRNRMKEEDFEKGVAQELLQEKVGQFLATFTPVTDQDVLEQYTFVREKVKIIYVEFSPDRYKASVKVDPVAREKYFQENKEKYRIPEKIKITYISLDPKRFEDQIRVSEQEVRDYYDDRLESFKEKDQVKARHILFKLEQGAEEAEEKRCVKRHLRFLQRRARGKILPSWPKNTRKAPARRAAETWDIFLRARWSKPLRMRPLS